MAREIRITVEDDEVFEHMKRRKNQLDLSWRDVLRRGLRDDGDDLASVKEDFSRQIRNQVAASLRASMPEAHDPYAGGFGGDDEFDDIAEEADGDDFDEEIEDLTDAEDALLAFPGGETDGVVPLRVRLRFDGTGLDVTVVAVRQGKNVAGRNVFTGDARRRVVEHLATGGTATLRLGDGEEEYAVRPVLDWGRDDGGRPSVTDVDIEEVVFDDAE